MPNRIAIEGSVVRLEGITVQNPDVAQYLSQKPQGERVPGADTRRRSRRLLPAACRGVGQSLDFVKLEIERLIQASRTAVDQLPESIGKSLQLRTAPRLRSRRLPQLPRPRSRTNLLKCGNFSNDISIPKPDATLGRALSTLTNLLDPKREDSVQKRVDLTLQGIAVADGAIAKAVRATVETAIAPLQTAIETFSLALKKEEGIEEALATTTRKGFAFEDELLPELQRWAAIVGADLEYTAPQNLPGDFTLTLNDRSIGGMPLKIVVEARDRDQRFGRARVAEQINATLAQWQANYGIYVSKTQSGLAAEIGNWSELSCGHGPVIACTVEHLKTALRFAVVDMRMRAAAEARRELDISSAERELGRFRSSLNHLTQIKRRVGEIRDVLPRSRTKPTGCGARSRIRWTRLKRCLSPA